MNPVISSTVTFGRKVLGPDRITASTRLPSGPSRWVTYLQPLEPVEQYIPDPLPAPLDQPADCRFGGSLVVTLADGLKLTYGPCRRPPSINSLWAAMIYVMGHGECSPHCGPNGEAPPQATRSATP